MERLFRATINSWHGLIACTKSEAAFREELALLVIGMPLAFFVTSDTGERFALIGVLFFLLIVELLNTAIEKLSDRVTRENDPLIKRVKDMGSAAICPLAGGGRRQSGCGFSATRFLCSSDRARAAARWRAAARTTAPPARTTGSARTE